MIFKEDGYLEICPIFAFAVLKSRIREKSISRPMRIVALIPKNPGSRAKIADKQTFLERQFYTLFKQKFLNLRPLLYITFPQGFQKSLKKNNIGLYEVGAKFKWNSQMKKKIRKKSFFVAAILHPL